MLKEILQSNEDLQKKIENFQTYINTPEYLQEIYKSTDFPDTFLPFAIQVLEVYPPEKTNARTTQIRTTILRTLFRTRPKESPDTYKLFILLSHTILHDTLHNRSLSIKCYVSILKKQRIPDESILDLLDCIYILITEIATNIISNTDTLIFSSFYTLSEAIPLLILLLKISKTPKDPFTKIIDLLTQFYRIFVNDSPDTKIFLSNEHILIEVISLFSKILKFHSEILMLSPKHDWSFKSIFPEVCIFLITFCPDDATDLKKEIFHQISYLTTKFKEVFQQYIEIIISEDLMIKSSTPYLRVLGLTVLTDIAFHYKDRLSKEHIYKIANTATNFLDHELSVFFLPTYSLSNTLTTYPTTITNTTIFYSFPTSFQISTNQTTKEYEEVNQYFKNRGDSGCMSSYTDNHNSNPNFTIVDEDAFITIKYIINTLYQINDIFFTLKHSPYEKTSFYLKNLHTLTRIFNITPYLLQQDIQQTKIISRSALKSIKNILHYLSYKEPHIFTSEENNTFSLLYRTGLFIYTKITEEKDILDEFCSIFLYLEEKVFLDIFNVNVYYLLTSTIFNNNLFCVWRFYLSVQNISAKVSYYLVSEMKYCLSCLDNRVFSSMDVLEGVSDKEKERGVNNSTDGQRGVSDKEKERGVNNSTDKQQGVSDKEKERGVNNSTDKQQGVNISSNEQQGDNNTNIPLPLFFLEAFKHIFKSLLIYPLDMEIYVIAYLHTILKTLITEDPYRMFYYKILKELFIYLGISFGRYNGVYRYLFTKLPDIIYALRDMMHKHYELDIFIELILNVPISLSVLIPCIRDLAEPLCKGLRGNIDLQFRSLRTLELCLDNLNLEYVESITEGYMYEIVCILMEMMDRKETNSIAARILGKLKTFNRKFLESTQTYIQKSYNKGMFDILCCSIDNMDRGGVSSMERGVSITSKDSEGVSNTYGNQHPFNNSTNQQHPFTTLLPLDTALTHAIQYIIGISVKESFIGSVSDIHTFKNTIKIPFVSKNLLHNSYILIANFIYEAAGWSFLENGEVIEKACKHLRVIKKERFSNFLRNKYQSALNFTHLKRLKGISMESIINKKQIFYDSILSLFECSNFTFENDSYSILKRLSTQVAVYKVIQRFKLFSLKTKIHFDYTPFIDALIESFGSTNNTLLVAQKILKRINTTILDVCEDTTNSSKVDLYDEILKKLCSLCSYEHKKKRSAGINGLTYFIKNIDLGDVWLFSKRCDILSTLLFYVRLSDKECNSVRDLIFYILRRTFDITDKEVVFEGSSSKDNNSKDINYNSSKDNNTNTVNPTHNIFTFQLLSNISDKITYDKDITVLLLGGITSISNKVREMSQSSLEYLSELKGLSVNELLEPYKDLIRNTIFKGESYFRNSNEQCAKLDSLSYILGLRPPLFVESVYPLYEVVIKRLNRSGNNPSLRHTSNPNINTHPNPSINTHPNPNMNTHPNPNINTHPNPSINIHPNPNMNIHPNPSMNIHPNPNMNMHPNSNHNTTNTTDIDVSIYSYKYLLSLITLSNNKESNNKEIIETIIMLFYKGLYSNITDIIELCKQGLRQCLIHHNNLSRKLLINLQKVFFSKFMVERLDIQSISFLINLLEIYDGHLENDMLTEVVVNRIVEVFKVEDINVGVWGIDGTVSVSSNGVGGISSSGISSSGISSIGISSSGVSSSGISGSGISGSGISGSGISGSGISSNGIGSSINNVSGIGSSINNVSGSMSNNTGNNSPYSNPNSPFSNPNSPYPNPTTNTNPNTTTPNTPLNTNTYDLLYKGFELISILKFKVSFLEKNKILLESIVKTFVILENNYKLLTNYRLLRLFKEIMERNAILSNFLFKHMNYYSTFTLFIYLYCNSSVMSKYFKENASVFGEIFFSEVMCISSRDSRDTNYNNKDSSRDTNYNTRDNTNIADKILYAHTFIFLDILNYKFTENEIHCSAVLLRECVNRNKDISILLAFLRGKVGVMSVETINYLFEFDYSFILNDYSRIKDKGVNDRLKSMTIEVIRRRLRMGGVSNKHIELEGVSEGDIGIEGVNNSNTRYRCVNNKHVELEGVSNSNTSYRGVSNKPSELEGVSNKHIEQHPFSTFITLTFSYISTTITPHISSTTPNTNNINSIELLGLEGSTEEFGKENEWRYNILSIFIDYKIRSNTVIEVCKTLITSNTSIKYKALSYLSMFMPDTSYFNALIYAHHEYKEITLPALQHLLIHYNSNIFESFLITVLRSEVLYKIHLSVTYPLIVKCPNLISYNVCFEVCDSIFRLYGTYMLVHCKMAAQLLGVLLVRCEDGMTRVLEDYDSNNTNTDCSNDNYTNTKNSCTNNTNTNYTNANNTNANITHFIPSTTYLSFIDVFKMLYTLNFLNGCYLGILPLPLFLTLDFSLILNVEKIDSVNLSKTVQYELEKYSSICEGKYDNNNSNTNYKTQIIATLTSLKCNLFTDDCIFEDLLSYFDVGFLLNVVSKYVSVEGVINSKTVFMILKYLIEECDECIEAVVGLLEVISKMGVSGGSVVYGVLLKKVRFSSVSGSSTPLDKGNNTNTHYSTDTNGNTLYSNTNTNNTPLNKGIDDNTLSSTNHTSNTPLSHISTSNPLWEKFREGCNAIAENMLSKYDIYDREVLYDYMGMLISDESIEDSNKLRMLKVLGEIKEDEIFYLFVLSLFKKESSKFNAMAISFYFNGLKFYAKEIRNDFYALLHKSINNEWHKRILYLFKFEWQKFKGNWLYCILRLLLMNVECVGIETFKFCVYGDDSYFENMFSTEKISNETSSHVIQTFYSGNSMNEDDISGDNKDRYEGVSNKDRYEGVNNSSVYKYSAINNSTSFNPTYLNTNNTTFNNNNSNPNLESFIGKEMTPFTKVVKKFKGVNILGVVCEMGYNSDSLVYEVFPRVFHAILEKMHKNEVQDIVYAFIDMAIKFKDINNRHDILGLRSIIHSFALLKGIYSFNDNYMSLCHMCNSYNLFLEMVNEEERMHIYEYLEEDDLYFGLLRTSSYFSETSDIALNHLLGESKTAILEYEGLMNKAKNGEMSFIKSEYDQWVSEWIKCAKELQDWDLIQELGNYTGDFGLITESSWRLSNFEIESDRSSFFNMLNLRKNCFDKKFYETFYLMYVNYDLNRIEELLKCATVEISKIPRCSNKYFNMLQQIQVIVEMQEARHIFNFSKNNVENIKWVMKTWRERMPLSHYSIENWMVLCTWRYHIYNRVSNLDLSEISTKGMHDLARNLNMLGKTARKNRCYDLSHNSLSKVFMLSNIEVVDAFKKIEEELKCYLCEEKYLEGLELACGANIDYFTVKEKGKIFFYKGLFTYFMERDSMCSGSVLGGNSLMSNINTISNNSGSTYNTIYNTNPYDNTLGPNTNPYSTNTPYSNTQHPVNTNNNPYLTNPPYPTNIPFTSHSPNTLYSSSSYTNSTNTPTTNTSFSNSPNIPYPNSPNVPNISYFSSKSEHLFLQSLQICPDVPECWFTYGIFMEKCYYDCRREEFLLKAFQAFLKTCILFTNNKSRISMMKIIKILLLASNSNTTIISNLTKEFEISINDLKIEFFFFFIRQFIDLLSTNSFECATIFIKKAISIHPQAVHTYLSVADSEINLSLENILDSMKSQEVLEERLNIENDFLSSKEDINVLHDLLTNTKLSSCSYNDISLCKVAHERLNNLMSFYKTHHGFTCFTVDMVINNILQIFESNNEEHSFIVIDFLLKHIFDNYSNFDLRNNKGLEALLNRMLGVLSLSKICQKYYDEFKNDFFSTTEISLSQVFAKVYKWKYIIENMMKSMPYNIRLDVLSSFLIDYENAKYSEIYVFGQYIPIKENYHNLVKIESFEPVVMLSWKNGYCIRKLEIRGSNGKKYFFAMHSHDTSLYKREEKIMQAAMFLDKEVECGTEFLFSMNDMISSVGNSVVGDVGSREDNTYKGDNTDSNANTNKISKSDLGRSNASVLALKRKNARLSPKLAIRISYKIRLISFRQSYFFLDDILNEWCTRIGYSYHYLAIKYMKYVDELAGRAVFFGCENDEGAGCSISVVNDNSKDDGGIDGRQPEDCFINNSKDDGMDCKQPEDCFINNSNSNGERLSLELKLGAYRKMVEFVSDSILKDRFLDYCGDFDVYFSFRKNFGVSFGSISWFIYMLGAYNREPSKLAIGLSDGSYYSLDVVPCLEEKYIFKSNESVNVRLTPNIQKFLGKEGVEGQMVSIFYNYSVFVRRGCLNDLIYVVINEDASFSEQLFFYKGMDEEKRIGFEKNIRVVMERMDMCCDGKKLLRMLNSSMDPENLCLMPLSWHPWY